MYLIFRFSEDQVKAIVCISICMNFLDYATDNLEYILIHTLLKIFNYL